jgi:hypothetical protein
VGWLGHHPPDAGDTSDNWNHRLYAGALFGYYWTEHLKTEAELGITSEGHSWAATLIDELSPDGFPVYSYEQREYRDLRLSVGQTWQFLDNRWVHPFITAGVDLDRSHLRREIQLQRHPRIPPGTTVIEESSWQPKPYIATGLKMYFTSTTFARMDVHGASGSGNQHIVWRIGIGKDF